MHFKSEIYSICDSFNGNLSWWDFDETNQRVLVSFFTELTFVNNCVLVFQPLELFDTINCDWFLLTFFVFNKVHWWELIYWNTSFSFNIFSFFSFSFELLGNIFTIETPLESIFIFTFLLVELSNDFNKSEVPNSVVIFHCFSTVSDQKVFTRWHLNFANVCLRDGNKRLKFWSS